jgi:hypothetical protein
VLALLSAFSVKAAGRCYVAQPVEDENNKTLPIEPACRVLEANLNEFCDEPPLMCGIKIAPKYARDLSLPKWKPVDLHGKIDLVEQTVRARWGSDQKAAQTIWNEERAPFEAGLAAGTLSLKSADLDLLGIGRKLTVYRIDPGTCEKKNQQVLQSRDPGVWNSGFLSSETEVMLSPSATREVTRQYFIGSWRENGDVVLYKNLPLQYWMGSLRHINSSEEPTFELQVWKSLILRQEGREPSIYRTDMYRFEYRASGGTK